jgi:hypothetical protein
MKRELKNATKEFILENKRAPTPLELRLLEQRVEDRLRPERTLEGREVRFQQVAEATQIVKSWEERRQTHLQALEELLALQAEYEELRQTNLQASKKVLHRLNKTLVAYDNLLQMKGTGVFYSMLEETLTTKDKVGVESTARVDNGVATLGMNNAAEISLDQAEIVYKVIAPKGMLTKKTNASVELLKDQDGNHWSVLVYTEYPVGDVNLVINASFKDPVLVKAIEAVGLRTSGTGKYTITGLYTLKNGKTKTAFPALRDVGTNNYFQINQEEVTSIALALRKNRCDEQVSGQYVYVFSLDQLRVTGVGTEEATESVLELGPYDFYDVENNELAFTKVDLEPCMTLPEGTSVQWNVSKNGIVFTPWSGTPVVIGEISDSGTYQFIDEGSDGYTLIGERILVDEASLTISAGFETEAILNKYIEPEERAAVSETSIVVKRGLLLAANQDVPFFNGTHGWWPTEQGYNTTVYVKESEGREIDFGEKPIRINGQITSGKVVLPQGYSTVTVFPASWDEIESGATNETALKRMDSLYPYNHKYLIQGYTYPVGYTGARIYNPFEEMFAAKLKYVSPELFSVLDKTDEDYYQCYTIDDREDGSFFLVKVNRSHSDWSSEKVSATWNMKEESGNSLYLKAVLRTSIVGNTPIIESIKMRVA